MFARGLTDSERAVLQSIAAKASASRIVNLVKSDFYHQAARFTKWRKKYMPKQWRPKTRIARRWTQT